MDIIELNTDNISDYKDIIDQDVAESIGREFYRGIAAKEGDSPSSALVWEYKNLEDVADTEAEIVFIGSGSEETIKELLTEFDDQTSDEDVVFSFFEAENLSEEAGKRFGEDGFAVSKGEGRDIVLKVSDLAFLVPKKKKIPPKIVGLGELMEIQFMQGVTNCLFHGKKGIIEDLEYIEKDWFDEKTSAAVITDGKITGLLLIHRFPSGKLMPVLLTAMGPDASTDLLNMIRFSAEKALENHPRDTTVILRRHNEPVRALVKKLFGEKTGEEAVRGERR